MSARCSRRTSPHPCVSARCGQPGPPLGHRRRDRIPCRSKRLASVQPDATLGAPLSNTHGLPRLAWRYRLALGGTDADAAACGLECVVARYDFITIDTVAVAFVLAATSLTYGTAYDASGRAYIVWFVVLGARVIDATEPSEPYS